MSDAMKYSAGIDVGSAFVKAVVLKGDKILSSLVFPVHGVGASTGQEVLDKALAEAGISFSSLAYVASTGFGEYTLPFAHRPVSPLLAGAYGAFFLAPSARKVIDFGMQQSSVIKLDDLGIITDSIISEKCASGSGWLLVVVARILATRVDQLGPLSLKADNPVALSSDCAVFAETEVISRISEGCSSENIVAGVHRMLAMRIKGLVHRLSSTPDCLLIGGGSKNEGFLKSLREVLGCEIKTTQFPQFESAIGAALYWRDRDGKQVK